MNFYGYKRPDGRVGVRNKVLILPAEPVGQLAERHLQLW